MKKISYWAKENIIKSRLLITAVLVFQLIAGMLIGLTWFANDILIGKEWEIVLIILFIGTIIIYPMQQKGNYKFRKTCDFALLNTMFFLTIIFSNQLPTKLGINYLAGAPKVTRDYQVNLVVLKEKNAKTSIDKEKNVNKKPTRTERKKLKQKLKSQLKKLIVGKHRRGLLIFLSLLLIVAIVPMFYLTVLVLCSLSCSGTVAAPLLAISMLNGGVIGGAIYGIAKIVRERRRLKREAEKE